MYVSGGVQGVGFRYATCQQACRLGVGGWVRNLFDGRVEMIISGDTQQVDQLIDWARSGPPAAQVEEIALHVQDYISMSAFTVRENG